MAATAMAVMALAMVATDTARGPLMPMPTMAVMALAAMAVTAMVATDTARGPLMPMPTMAATAMAVMALAMVVTDTARGLLMPMPTMAATAMAVMALAMAATATASKPTTNLKVCNSILTPKLSSQNIIHNSAAWKIDGCVSFNYQPNNK